EITGGRGVDVAVEALGKPQTFMQCTKSVCDGGKAVMIGLASTNVMGEVDITRLVRRQIKSSVHMVRGEARSSPGGEACRDGHLQPSKSVSRNANSRGK
ncbi:hypothetical protein ACMD2_23396, partial [Ananas comosus]